VADESPASKPKAIAPPYAPPEERAAAPEESKPAPPPEARLAAREELKPPAPPEKPAAAREEPRPAVLRPAAAPKAAARDNSVEEKSVPESDAPLAKEAEEPEPSGERLSLADGIARLAAIRVASEPSDAHVLIDGVERGRTPVRVGSLPKGRHEIEIRAAGHEPYRKAIELEGGTTAQVTAALAPVGAGLTVLSEPPGLPVSVNGTPHGMTPVSLHGLPPGAYDVVVAFPGVPPETRRTELRGNEMKEIRFSLSR
jgi:hypothetical protein